jgi:iron complex outermembrane receptor protein
MRNSKGQNATRARLLTCGATAAIATACAFAVPVMAQDTAAVPTDDTTTVVVTGIRRGIQDAISAKKKSAQIVEAVSAEDIGKLPDASIAESIARLPGIAAQRTNGRAQSLSIRGLGPDYTVTTLNGREQVSTGDNRSVEFDQYPSELISQVLIYKTPNAGMTTQGIAGTADLQTVRPLAYGKRAAAINVRGEQNSEDAAIAGMENTGNRYSLMYIDQFANKTVGLALGYAHTDSPYQVQKKEPWGDGGFPTCGACLPGDQDLLILGGAKDGIISSNLTRDGYMGVLEWKPNDQLHMTLDAYHSDFRELQKIARIEYPLAWGDNHLQPGYTAGNTFVTHGVFNDVAAVVENYTNDRKAKLDAVGLNTEYKLNDNWDLMADLAYSKVERDDVILESTAGTGANKSGPLDTITFDSPDEYGLSTLHGVVDYSNFDTTYLTDPGGWGGPVANRAGYVKAPHIEDELSTIKLAATRHLDNVFSSVSIGYTNVHRQKDKRGVEGFLWLKTGPEEVVPEKYRLGTTDATFLGGSSGMISYDGLAMYRDGYFNFTQDVSQDSVKRTWNVDEHIDVVFIKADLDTQLFGLPLTGNIGIQSQHAKQTATSYFTDGTATGMTLRSESADYTDILPSANFNFALADDMTLRFGAGVTIARPRMDDMAAGVGYGPIADGNQPVQFGGQSYYWSGSGGNPTLKPWKATAVDISWEKYFGRKGYVSIAGFHKTLNSYIFNQTVLRDYTGAALPAGADPLAYSLANANRTGTVSVMQNGTGGWIRGVEGTISIPGDMLTPYLNGFGLIMSAAFNESEINPSGTNPIDLPGLSRKVINTTVYYENHGFSARLSNRYRGDFLGEVPDYTNSLQSRYVAGESLLDAQLGYEFQDGGLKGLSLSFSATNITNEPFKLYTKGNKNNVMRHEVYGSTYLFGVNYKFF